MAKLGYSNAVISDKGDPIQATISVFLAGTTILATIYADLAGTILKANPFQTDILGRFQFFAAAGVYDVTVFGSGITTFEIEGISLSDITLFSQLTDAPGSFVGAGRRAVAVKADETGLEFASSPVGGVPVGGIIMWSGTIAAIPANWQLCNGTNGTPDLRDRFVVGAKQDDAGVAKTNVSGSLTKSGGSATHLAHANHAAMSHPGMAIGAHNSDRAAYDAGGQYYARPDAHSVTPPDAHPALSHDTPSILNPYYALAFIQRIA
jgi:hypothetical protein